MKTKNLKVSAIALAVTLAASSGAMANDVFKAGKQAPNLSVQEKVLFSLNETSVSIVAALVDAVGCSAASDDYSYSATVFFDGTGSATIDDYTINAMVVPEAVNPGGLRGTRVDVSDSGTEDIGDLTLQNLEGSFYFSRKGEIMYSRADFEINPNALGSRFEFYDEHVIKDYYWSSFEDGGVFNSGRGGIRDAGLEVITKLNYPRSKWREVSEYLQPNGVIGKLSITKFSIAPENAPECRVEIFEADVIDFGDGLQLGGAISVQQLGGGF